MKNSKKLMEERGALVEELETLLDTVATEERDFSDNENERQDAIHSQIVDLDDAIQRAKNNEAVFAAAAGEATSRSEANEVAQIRGKFSISKAIQDIANTGETPRTRSRNGTRRPLRTCQDGPKRTRQPHHPVLPHGREARERVVRRERGRRNHTQNQGDKVRGIDHAPIVEGLRPVPVLERMGATVIQATGDLVLPSLPNVEATATVRGCRRLQHRRGLWWASCSPSGSPCEWTSRAKC